MSDNEDTTSSSDESDEDPPPRKLDTKEEVGQYLYEVASSLESSKEAFSQIGVAQCMAVVEKVLDGKVDIEHAKLLGEAWECGTKTQQVVPCGSATSAVRRLSAAVQPSEIWVVSPNHWQHCCGIYKFTSRTINGQPLWAKGSERYLYSTPSGKWRITNDTADFGTGGGYIISTDPHEGVPPQSIENWTIKNVIDADVVITSYDRPSYKFTDADGDEIVFISNSCHCQYSVNGVPRLPVSKIAFDPDSCILSFPQYELEIQISSATAFRDLTQLSRIISQSGVDSESVPCNPSRLFLAAWQVSAGGHIDGTQQYFYHSETRETTWDLCTKLVEFLKSG